MTNDPFDKVTNIFLVAHKQERRVEGEMTPEGVLTSPLKSCYWTNICFCIARTMSTIGDTYESVCMHIPLEVLA